MSDWLDNFQMMGASLNEGEKILMRFAMKKERNDIVKLLEDKQTELYKAGEAGAAIGLLSAVLLIKGEQK
jgi:hypothetical protein